MQSVSVRAGQWKELRWRNNGASALIFKYSYLGSTLTLLTVLTLDSSGLKLSLSL